MCITLMWIRILLFSINADLDMDATFHFNADLLLDPAPHQSDANLQPLVYRPSTPPL
jgi:hypothetical protein